MKSRVEGWEQGGGLGEEKSSVQLLRCMYKPERFDTLERNSKTKNYYKD